ncbi:MAG: hypothetical protein PVG49_20290 [Desulfobacteraceae bacterium]|jgi:rubrerythrin
MRPVSEYIARCFAEESRGASRAEAFALQAEKDGRSALALLFRTIANAQGVRARRFGHLMRGKIGTTEENLAEAAEAAADREGSYAAMLEDIRAEGPSEAVRKGFIQSRKTVEEMKTLLQQASEGKGPGADTACFVCQICGHIHFGSIPKNCPICGAVPGRFQRVE